MGKRLINRKGVMARRLVYFCIAVLTITLIWAAGLHTYAVLHNTSVDLSSVLTFVGTAFGGELLLLCIKRVFAKPNKESAEYGNFEEETVEP